MNNLKTAFHRAGHVVMAMLWGVWSADKVSIVGRGSSGSGSDHAPVTRTKGKVQMPRLGTPYFDAKLEPMLAGPVAQAILLGSEVVYRGSKRDPDFKSMVSEIQDSFPDGSTEKAWEVIYQHEPVVHADLKRVWPVVVALAQELMRQKELSDYEIRSLVRTAVNKLPESERTWAISRLRSTPPR